MGDNLPESPPDVRTETPRATVSDSVKLELLTGITKLVREQHAMTNATAEAFKAEHGANLTELLNSQAAETVSSELVRILLDSVKQVSSDRNRLILLTHNLRHLAMHLKGSDGSAHLGEVIEQIKHFIPAELRRHFMEFASALFNMDEDESPIDDPEDIEQRFDVAQKIYVLLAHGPFSWLTFRQDYNGDRFLASIEAIICAPEFRDFLQERTHDVALSIAALLEGKGRTVVPEKVVTFLEFRLSCNTHYHHLQAEVLADLDRLMSVRTDIQGQSQLTLHQRAAESDAANALLKARQELDINRQLLTLVREAEIVANILLGDGLGCELRDQLIKYYLECLKRGMTQQGHEVLMAALTRKSELPHLGKEGFFKATAAISAKDTAPPAAFGGEVQELLPRDMNLSRPRKN